MVAIETPSGKRNLNMNINAQQAILNAHIYIQTIQVYKNLFANVSLLHRNIIRSILCPKYKIASKLDIICKNYRY